MNLKHKSPPAAWLTVAILSVMFMGIMAFLVALSRAPGFNLLFSDQNFFKTALVVHVALSVVIWFLAYILFLTYKVTSFRATGFIDYLPAFGAGLGVMFIVITPFLGPADPILNNYVPTLNRPTYFLGVGLFLLSALAGFALRSGALLAAIGGEGDEELIIPGSLGLAGITLTIGILCFVIAWFTLSGSTDNIKPFTWFETLFWGGGHVLQFANTLGLMAVWALLAGKPDDGSTLLDGKIALGVFCVMLFFAIGAPVQYFTDGVMHPNTHSYFVNLKGYGVALGPIAVGIAIWLAGFPSTDSVARRGLILSMALFALGGVIALTIDGSDTRVPAHYHGVIGAVTLSFMAYALVATTKSGWLTVSEAWRKRQLTLYGAGQTLFVLGLFIGGLSGLPRKTFGDAQSLDSLLKITGMGVMGIGGLLAVTGGVMFVVFMLKALAGPEND